MQETQQRDNAVLYKFQQKTLKLLPSTKRIDNFLDTRIIKFEPINCVVLIYLKL